MFLHIHEVLDDLKIFTLEIIWDGHCIYIAWHSYKMTRHQTVNISRHFNVHMIGVLQAHKTLHGEQHHSSSTF